MACGTDIPARRAEAIARTASASCSSRSAMTARCPTTSAQVPTHHASTPPLRRRRSEPATTQPPTPTRTATPATRALPGTAHPGRWTRAARPARQRAPASHRPWTLAPRSQAARPSTTTMSPLKRPPRARRASRRRPRRDRRARKRSGAPFPTLRTHRAGPHAGGSGTAGPPPVPRGGFLRCSRPPRRPAVRRADARDARPGRSPTPPGCGCARPGRSTSDIMAIVSSRQSRWRVEFACAVDERPLVPGVHRLQHVERLAAADLTDDDAVRPHPERVAHQVANRHLPLALRRWPGVPRGRPRAVSRAGARRRPRS